MNDKIEKLTQILKESNNIVFFGGLWSFNRVPYRNPQKNSHHSLVTIITIY